MTSIKTISQDVIEMQFNCGGKTTYIYIKKIGSECRIDILRMNLIDLNFNDAIDFNNALQMAINIANEFDYSIAEFSKPRNALFL